jgi:hypothetical protein
LVPETKLVLERAGEWMEREEGCRGRGFRAAGVQAELMKQKGCS